MSEQIILDTWCTKDCTIGRLSYGELHCFTLELPWLDNKKGVSCIPPGIYQLTKYQSPKHGPVLLLHDVPNRTYIEIHAGNFTHQIEGCILVGDSITYLNSDTIPDVTNSKTTLKSLLALVPDEVYIKIQRSL
jgi:hypothetical protein